MNIHYVAPKRGKDYEMEVCTEEYLHWKDMWHTIEDKETFLRHEHIEWERHESDAVNRIRMAAAYMDYHNIVKYKPEYASQESRRRVREGYNPVVVSVDNPTVTELSVMLNSGDDGDDAGELYSRLIWPEMPNIGSIKDNFDKPQWYDTMKLMVAMGRHISLEGPPSIGKDTAVEQLAAEMNMPLVTIGGDAGFRTRDLTGGQQMVNGTSFYDVGEYAAAAVFGWWVLLTEVNAADPSAIMYINRQLASPYVVNFGGKSFPVHANFRLFVSYNHGLVGTKPLPQSFKDRFFPIKETFFTEAQLRRRMAAMGWSNQVVHELNNSIIVAFGIAMWDAYEAGKMRYQITTRRLKDAVDLMVVGNVDVKSAIKSAVLATIDSAVEYKAAENVLNSVMSMQSVPDIASDAKTRQYAHAYGQS